MINHVYNLSDVSIDEPSVVTIGVFDGIHRGHQSLINSLVKEAHTTGRKAVVLTFFPHPDVVLRGINGRYYLTSPEQRADQLIKLGVDCVVSYPFDENIRQMRAADFVDQLIQHLKLDSLWIGSDFAMGYQREGNVEFLQAQGAQKDFIVQAVDLMMDQQHVATITSTRIRDLLLAGDVGQVQALLGRGYAVQGEVVHGEKRGRKIGFPTANVDVWKQQVIPANGVYAGWAWLGEERFMAITNVGIRPTFAGDDITVEAHLLDFDRDIYGEQLQVTFETRLRGEKKFNGIDELVAQIQSDVEAGRRFLTEHME